MDKPGTVKVYEAGHVFRAEIVIEGSDIGDLVKDHPRVLGGIVTGHGTNPESAIDEAVTSLGRIIFDCLKKKNETD